MDVIGFLCVLIASSTAQLYDSLGNRCTCACSEAGFSSQMATVPKDYITKEQHSVVHLFVSERTQLRLEVFVT
jgi:hypothetical protein